MLTIVGIVLLALGLLLSIALHEVGHLLPAKRFGVRVPQYMVGFGPTVWSRKRGDTEYGLKAIPLGGYIRMIGMYPPARGQDPSRLRRSGTGWFRTMVDDARRVSLDEVGPGDAQRVFYKLPVRQRVVIMLGGPTMNLLLGVVFLGVAMSGVGTPVYRATTTVSAVPDCVVPASVQRSCTPKDPASPAAAAGLQVGDRVTAVAGSPVSSWSALSAAIRRSPAGPTPLTVQRHGRTLTLTANLLQTQRYRSETDRSLVRVGYLGVTPAQVLSGRETLPLAKLPAQLGRGLEQTAGAIVNVPARMVGVWQAAFGTAPRSTDSPIGVVGVSRIGGQVAAAKHVPLYGKVSLFLGVLGSVNLALFVFNLVPLLPLDGGHVAGALFEGARRKVAQWRERPDPGPVDVARMLPLAYTVAVLLIGMSALLLYADVVNPVRI